MNNLLRAAKAVIDRWDIQEPWKVGRPHMMSKVEKLRAAVERAEKQEAVGFDDWWDANADIEMMEVAIHKWDECWTAAQQAERERIKEIIREATGGFGNCERLMEKIDASEDS